MYIPQSFNFEGREGKVSFMKRYSFATIITPVNEIPVATHLPFVVTDTGDRLVLSSHFSAANKQAQQIALNTSLVIFNGPHAYISPKHYDKELSVPTWDYIAVHAYGKARTIEDTASKLALLEQMIGSYEQEYMKQWKNLPDHFKFNMLKGIIAFEIEVTILQGQKKLSQNKTVAERQRIIKHLEENTGSVEHELAQYIRELEDTHSFTNTNTVTA